MSGNQCTLCAAWHPGSGSAEGGNFLASSESTSVVMDRITPRKPCFDCIPREYPRLDSPVRAQRTQESGSLVADSYSCYLVNIWERL